MGILAFFVTFCYDNNGLYTIRKHMPDADNYFAQEEKAVFSDKRRDGNVFWYRKYVRGTSYEINSSKSNDQYYHVFTHLIYPDQCDQHRIFQ